MTGLIFGVIVPVLLSGGYNIQPYIDKYEGVWLGSTVCNNGKYILSHDYRLLGKKISKLQKNQKIRFGGCDYEVQKREIRKIGSSMKFVNIRSTYLQTCINTTHAVVYTLRPL